jgi:hypothetical protein
MSDIFGGETFAEQTEYLRCRGIDDLTAKKLGLEIVGPTRLKELGFKHKAGVQRAILFPIYQLDGGVGGYGARLFYQKTFGKDSRAKFLHPPSVSAKPPSLYFSPLANWEYLEYGQRILICESYIKANIAAKLGFHAIGVSGCWGWSHNQELHWAMQELDWRGKRLVPVLCMDSDVNTESVKLSGVIKHFQAKCEAVLGVKAEMLTLPASPGGDKWGLDDYFMHHGESETLAFLSADAPEIRSELDAHLAQMNNEVCVIRDVGKFADIDRNILMGRGQFEDINYADRKAWIEDKKVKVSKVWTEWDKRNIVDTLKYKPGQERIVNDGDQSYFNLWRGWGCEPLAGDASYFTEWLEDAFPSDVERGYFLDWWAYQLQYPGIKLNTALMLVGPSGVGKGWMASIAERIFGGDNTWKCNLSDLESRFNSGLGAAQLMVIEEADVAGGVKVYNVLKDMITNEHLRYERKGVDAVKIDNCLNIFLNSNHIGVLQLDEFDRRFAILEITNEAIANDAMYWEPRWEWIREGGAASVFGYLLRRDVSAFNPHGEAPWSQAKADMIESTHHPLDTWVRDYVKRGEAIVVGQSEVDGSLMSAKELAWCYSEGAVPLSDIDRKATMQMVKALNNARVQVANAGKKIKYQGLPTKFYWVGTAGAESNYQEQLDNRLFWKRLVASQQGEVASEGSTGYPESNKKY